MRRRGRECALQILYQLDVGRQLDGACTLDKIEEELAKYWDSFDNDAPVDREFAARLVHGVVEDLSGIDAAVGNVSQNWRLERMGAVDRNLIRIAAYEILRCPDIPRRVSINEALEIAKKFGGDQSRSFVNGVLDQLGDDEGALE